MAKSGPILIIDDDLDDQVIMKDLFREIGVPNDLIFFEKGMQAFHFLKATTLQPFLILSDVNLPEKNGIEFKRQIDDDPQLRAKSIPFIFFSTYAGKKSVDMAYKEMTVQGFFQKKGNYEELKADVKLIIDYWAESKHPNS